MEGLRFVKIKQTFPRPAVADPYSRVLAEMERIGLRSAVRPGRRIAITAGSRGIKNIVPILRALADAVREAGGDPFVVGSMGSHGGGTARGQEEVLESLGISEKAMGCPVLTSSETLETGSTPEGVRAHCDVNAWQAGGIIVCNRVKPHTTFHGPVESGLCKMIGVGLGKAMGASLIHHLGPDRMSRTILDLAGIFIESGKILAGVGMVENAYEDTAIIEACPAGEIPELDRRLLEEAYSMMPRLPVAALDFLVVREMGKNLSGTGMDTNIIGRIRIAGVPEPERPFIRRIAVLDLTAESHGNASGIGLADITTSKLVEKTDFGATYLNCLTSGNVQRAMIPITMPDDREAVRAVLQSFSGIPAETLRGAVIKNTLELEQLWVTENLITELKGREDIVPVSGPRPLSFRGGALCLDDSGGEEENDRSGG